MKFIETEFDGLFLIEPFVYSDERGYFYESYNESKWKQFNKNTPIFVQNNESLSNKNVLRGLHFQKPPFSQGKLIRVIKGSVIDVAVDIRRSSKTFGNHFKILLSAENKKQIFIPEGFAHGFLALEDETILSYKCTGFYNKESEDGLRWNDPELAIDWGIKKPILSKKDEDYKDFSKFVTPF